MCQGHEHTMIPTAGCVTWTTSHDAVTSMYKDNRITYRPAEKWALKDLSRLSWKPCHNNPLVLGWASRLLL